MSMIGRRRALQLGGAVAAAGVTRGAAAAASVERWGVFEASFAGPAAGNPFQEVTLSAQFSQGGRRISVAGFYDGDGTYRVRFMPPAIGTWRFVTRSNSRVLDGKTGSFVAAPPTANNRGPVSVRDTHHFAYADGTPYFQIGSTCYAWTHQPQGMQQETLATLARSPFNKLRFCVFPKSYEYNKNDPDRYAFQRRADGSFDASRPDPVFWRQFERRILDLQRLGIEADLILWHPYDRWGFSTMSDEEDDRYLRYAIARLSAFRNVWWSLANEYDLMIPSAKHPKANKSPEDWDRFFQALVKQDPYGHLRSIHNWVAWYDHSQPWVTHASIQTSDMAVGARLRAKYGKPVVYDECKYEGDLPQGWGKLTAREMTERFWMGALGGCYVGHSESYQHPQDLIWWSKGGTLRGESPARIAFFKRFLDKGPPFHAMVPAGDLILAVPGKYHLVYCAAGQERAVELPGDASYTVDAIDPWAMTETTAGFARPGVHNVWAKPHARILRFTPKPVT